MTKNTRMKIWVERGFEYCRDFRIESLRSRIEYDKMWLRSGLSPIDRKDLSRSIARKIRRLKRLVRRP